MVNSYVVSLLLIAAVPRDRRLEHLFVAASGPDEAERLACAIIAEHPDLGRFQVGLITTSELPLLAVHAPPQTTEPQIAKKDIIMVDRDGQTREDPLLTAGVTQLRALAKTLDEHAWTLSVRGAGRALASLAQHLRDDAHSLELLAMMVPAMENLPPDKKAEVNAHLHRAEGTRSQP